MTLIVASLFLPYTVEFEAEKPAVTSAGASAPAPAVVPALIPVATPTPAPAPIRPKPVHRNSSTNLVPRVADTTTSIFPALIARSHNLTPAPAVALGGPATGTENGDEEFFYKHKSVVPTPVNLLTPMSKANSGVTASIVDARKPTMETLGLPSLRVSRGGPASQSPLPGRSKLSQESVNPSLSDLSLGNGRSVPSNHPQDGINRVVEALNPGVSGKTGVPNAKPDRLSLSPSFEDEETELAPYGGFSRPDVQSMVNSPNVFNDAPFTIVPFRKGNGSLRNAVQLSSENGTIGQSKWVGTIGVPCDEIPESKKKAIAHELQTRWASLVAYVSDTTFQGHYKSFCKQILWPSLHYQIPDNPKNKAFEEHSWEHYRALNQAIADKVAETYESEDDIVWVNDYHLFLVPAMVRAKLPNAKIGFFLHVSFPSSEVFRCFAQRKGLLAGMLGADSISFQTTEYVRHFLQTCNRLLLADISATNIFYNNRIIGVEAIPVGIDAQALTEQLGQPDVRAFREAVSERWRGKRLIVSRDTFDRIRGLKQKLLAYERFLTTYPDFVETTVLIQICSEGCDEEFEGEIMVIVDRINSLATSFAGSQPVVFLNQDIDFAQYLALLSEADAFAVTTQREGMNLTCHEFTVATSTKHSPLILSEFTGSASVLSQALLVNPWDLHEVSEAFWDALTMSAEERTKRWTRSYAEVVKKNSQVWVESCLLAIVDAWTEHQVRCSSSVISLTPQRFSAFMKPGKRVFFLDLISSTITVVKGNQLISDQSQRMVPVLVELLADPDNLVYMISHSKKTILERIFHRLPRLGLIAENGGYVKPAGVCSKTVEGEKREWRAIVDESELGWMDPVAKMIESMVVRLPGSHLEVKDCSVRFNLAKCRTDDAERTDLVIGDCITYINEFLSTADVYAACVDNVVIVQKRNLLLSAVQSITNALSEGQDPIQTALFMCAPSTYLSEPVFEHFNEFEADKKATNLMSVAMGENKGTYAKTSVKGLVELFTIMGANR